MSMQTIGELLSVVAALPPDERRDAVARLERIIELREPTRHLALGLLALDLAPQAATITRRATFSDEWPQSAAAVA